MAQRLPSNKKILEDKIRYYFIRARKMKIEAGWLWLYENGFACRVPPEVRDKIAKYEEGGE